MKPANPDILNMVATMRTKYDPEQLAAASNGYVAPIVQEAEDIVAATPDADALDGLEVSVNEVVGDELARVDREDPDAAYMFVTGGRGVPETLRTRTPEEIADQALGHAALIHMLNQENSKNRPSPSGPSQ